ncbi:MAG: metal ABC transporter substrate-binding protein, partial [Bacteriovorax sp.]
LSLFVSINANAKIKVVTTTTDLESIVKTVGGDYVETLSIAKGTQDPHQLEAKPSYMVKMRDADLVVAQGLELEDAWLVPLINGSRNPKIKMSGGNYLGLGSKLDPIEIPKGDVSRAEGDVHPGGNPHFQLDPIRLGTSAQLIANKLSELDIAHKNIYEENAQSFQKKMNDRCQLWQSRIKKTGIKEIISYHKDISYLCERFNLKCDLQLEPKPGIPPSANHIFYVINEIKKRDIKLVLIENYFDMSISEKLTSAIPGLRVVKVPISVGGEPAIKNNFDLFERIVSSFEQGNK